jgi:nucleoside-diphosphate-sugar epimerase
MRALVTGGGGFVGAALCRRLRDLGHDVTAPITRFFFHPSFPVDARHNAKIFRDRLAAWAATQTAIECDGPSTDVAGNA